MERPLLAWAVTPANEELDLTWGEATTPLGPDLSDLQVDEALMRLKQHGMIRGHRWEGSGASGWSGIRVTADGLRVLGEWPPVESAVVNDALVFILRELAATLPDDEDATAARRAGSAVSKMSGGAVWDTVKGKLRGAGEELGS